MRHKPTLLDQVQRRIFQVHEAIRVDTQAFRERWIVKLDELFDFAISIANPDKNNTDSRRITPKEQQMWAQIATRLCEVMANLSKGFDERQFNEDLVELEKQVDEIKKFQAQNNGAGDSTTRADPEWPKLSKDP